MSCPAGRPVRSGSAAQLSEPVGRHLLHRSRLQGLGAVRCGAVVKDRPDELHVLAHRGIDAVTAHIHRGRLRENEVGLRCQCAVLGTLVDGRLSLGHRGCHFETGIGRRAGLLGHHGNLLYSSEPWWIRGPLHLSVLATDLAQARPAAPPQTVLETSPVDGWPPAF
jgi:hypothetical protein